MRQRAVTLWVSALLIVTALLLMILCLIWFTPKSMVLFLGLGLPCGVVGILLFLLHVILDLRARNVL